jgi:hypothetical protein
MWIVIVLIAGGLVAAAFWSRSVRRRERVRNSQTGQVWTPHCLYVCYECTLLPDADPADFPDDARLVRLWKALACTAALSRATSMETPAVGRAMRCNRCRMFDLRGLRRRDRWVLYTLAAELVDACRLMGVRACASLAGDPTQGVSAFLCHAHIPEIAQHDEVFADLVRDRLTNEQRLESFRWLTEDPRAAA